MISPQVLIVSVRGERRPSCSAIRTVMSKVYGPAEHCPTILRYHLTEPISPSSLDLDAQAIRSIAWSCPCCTIFVPKLRSDIERVFVTSLVCLTELRNLIFVPRAKQALCGFQEVLMQCDRLH